MMPDPISLCLIFFKIAVAMAFLTWCCAGLLLVVLLLSCDYIMASGCTVLAREVLMLAVAVVGPVQR